MQYTWGLLLLTLKQVEEELGVMGNLAAMWELVEVEEGGGRGVFGGVGVWRGIWGWGGGGLWGRREGEMDVLSSGWIFRASDNR